MQCADDVAFRTSGWDRIIEQADRTYQRSLKDARKIVTFRSESGENQTETVEGQAGDMAALGVKLKAVEMKLKLLNAFPKEQKDTNVIIQQINWGDLATPIPSGDVLEIKPSSKVEARIEAESKIETPLSNNGNGELHA